jgi:hypothetical protein
MPAGSYMVGMRAMNVAYIPGSRTSEIYRRHRERQLSEAAARLPARPALQLQNFGGKTIEQLGFQSFYVDPTEAWPDSDIAAIDEAMRAAMQDTDLNNVLAQYFEGRAPTTTTAPPSRRLDVDLGSTVYRDTIETVLKDLHGRGDLPDVDLGTTVFNFLLPPDVVLTDSLSSGPAEADADEDADTLPIEHEEADSHHGLGGYHGSIHPDAETTLYYAVGVYSQTVGRQMNGIDAFGVPWKNVVATFYHELQEARTDPDVSDAATRNDEHLLGWYCFDADLGGEIGDIPINQAEAAHDPLSDVFQEIPLTNGGTVPVQLMFSNVMGGPSGPVPQPTQP